jgi:23S rRNA pseudouridine1911/1915/1917 synthase
VTSARRWIVRAGDETGGVDAVVGRMGPAGRGAIDAGRAFVNGTRAAAGAAVKVGDVVEVWAARPIDPGADLEPTVLTHRREVVFADKPAALPTEPERRGGDSLVTRIGRLLKSERVHAMSRLDLGVSGVILCASGSRGTAALTRARDEKRYRRIYVAIAAGIVEGTGTWDTPIDGREARTAWAARHHGRDATWLELELDTGRTHQIRIHSSGAGHALYGDRAYRGPTRVTSSAGGVIEPRRIMLHAAAARVDLPVDEGGVIEAASPVPEEMRAVWRALDGDPAAWEEWLPPWHRSDSASHA